MLYSSKIGIIGLVEEEWITTLATIQKDDIIYESYIEAGNRLAKQLKNDEVSIVLILI